MGHYSTQFFDPRYDPQSLIREAFSEIQSNYSTIVKKVVKKQSRELTENDIYKLNDSLAQIHLKIIAPALNAPINHHSHILCFYSDDKLDMDVKVTQLGHPSVDKKEARLKCILKKTTSTNTYKYTRVDESLLSYLSQQSGSTLIDEYINQWIVESKKSNQKEGYNEIILYIGGINNRKNKDHVNVMSSFTYSRTLEHIIAKKIWDFLSLQENQMYKDLCMVCSKPVSRKNSRHCGSKICKDKVKSLRNHSYYKNQKLSKI